MLSGFADFPCLLPSHCTMARLNCESMAPLAGSCGCKPAPTSGPGVIGKPLFSAQLVRSLPITPTHPFSASFGSSNPRTIKTQSFPTQSAHALRENGETSVNDPKGRQQTNHENIH